MDHFWKWLGLSVLCAALGYGALIGVSVLDIPWRSPHFDTVVATTSQRGWVNEARYFMLNKRVFAERGNRVVVIGASNARDPFRPDIMERGLPGWQVANASLSGAAIDEIADAVDLYYLERDAGPGNRTAFVLCLNYLQFLPTHYGEGQANPLATEAARGGLYERRDGRLAPRYPRGMERALEAVAHPQAVAASLPRRMFRALFVNPRLPTIKNFVDRFRGHDPLSRWTEYIGEHADLDVVNVPGDVQRALMAQRLVGAGGDKPMAAGGFQTLAEVVARIRSHGDSVVIVDLPLPDWHFAGVPVTDASYRANIDGVLARSGDDPAVSFLSLREFDASDNFFDSAHTKPRLWPVLSARLAQKLAASPALAVEAPAAR